MHHTSLLDVPSFFSGDLEGLKIFYTNIDQFLNKKDEKMAIAGNEPDIILITEILPKSDCNTITVMRISLSHYQPFFNFDPTTVPPSSVMCGFGIYVSEKLLCCEVSFDNSHFDEQVWVKVVLKGSDSLLVGCIYHSPSSNMY